MVDDSMRDDPIFREEQEHLSATYAQLVAMRDALSEELGEKHASIAQDLIDMSEEIRPDFVGADETMETLAAIETLNAVIDAYNQSHDFATDKLRRILLLLMQPYFAKVRLQMRPGRPARDVYIGAAGVTDENARPLIVDWRSPVAETYYNQQMGPTSYLVDGRERKVSLELRRQFDITQDVLNLYFDTTVAIEDSLLLRALRRHHSEKLQAITATIQREQNAVVRHEDVPALLVQGIAGSGKTSVLLQRIAYLFYRHRDDLRPEQVYLFTPNEMFGRYIDTVLPSLGESNPQTYTWRSFLAALGLSQRGSGADGSPERLRELEESMAGLHLESEDLHELRIDDYVLLKPSQVARAVRKFERFGIGPRFCALVCDELHAAVERRLSQIARTDEWQEELLGLDVEQQLELFGETMHVADEEEILSFGRRWADLRFASSYEAIENLCWLRIDRLGMRMLGTSGISAAEWLYLKLLLTGHGARDARYVMIDEVQDYSPTQLMVLARYFTGAHILLLGDANQATTEGTASFDEMRRIFAATHEQVEYLELTTSYRSSPEITELFARLMPEEQRRSLSSVRAAGVVPRLIEVPERDAYVATIASLVDEAAEGEGLVAVVVDNPARASWLARQLGDRVRLLDARETLPTRGVVLMELRLAKGLEFDQVIIADAQEEVYPDTPLARRRLYTAISRAMHQVCLVAQGPMTPLLR